jgi:hypothetical protein
MRAGEKSLHFSLQIQVELFGKCLGRILNSWQPWRTAKKYEFSYTSERKN